MRYPCGRRDGEDCCRCGWAIDNMVPCSPHELPEVKTPWDEPKAFRQETALWWWLLLPEAHRCVSCGRDLGPGPHYFEECLECRWAPGGTEYQQEMDELRYEAYR